MADLSEEKYRQLSDKPQQRPTNNLEATALKAYLVSRSPVNGPCEPEVLVEYRDACGCVEGRQTVHSQQQQLGQLTSTSMQWLQKVAAGICYMHCGPSMDLPVRISSKFSSGFEVPDASEPQDPGRTQAANTTRLSTTTHSTRKVLSAVIVDSYARCQLHGLVI